MSLWTVCPLKYYNLYEPPTPKKPGYEFNKPKVEHEPLTPQPPGSAYDEVDDLSLFSLLLDPHMSCNRRGLRITESFQNEITT